MNTSGNYSMTLQEEEDHIKVDFLGLKKAALIIRAINHKLRQQIVKLLDEQQKLTVTEIYVRMRLEQSVASQHLAILRKAGIVKTTREGKFIYYSVNHSKIKKIMECVEILTN